jgi:hypothetical protein
MSRKLRALIAVLVLVVATTAAAQAFPLTDGSAAMQRGDFLGAVLSWFSTVLTPVWERAGSQMDPNGDPTSGAPLPAPTADEGSSMDPNGG